MRLKDVAYEIGITRQELKKELQKTNFGVDSSAREIPDGLAQGVIRMLAPKYKKQKEELTRREIARVRSEALEKGEDPDLAVERFKNPGAFPEDSLNEAIASQEVIEKEEREEKITHAEPVSESIVVSKPEELKEEHDTAVKRATGPIRFQSARRVAEGKKRDEERRHKEDLEKKEREEQRKIEKERQEEVKSIAVKAQKDFGPKVYKGENKQKTATGGNVISVHRKIEFGGARKKKDVVVPAAVGHKAAKRFKTRDDFDDEMTEAERIAALAEKAVQRQLEDEAFKASQAKRRAKMQTQKTLDAGIVKKEGVVEIGDVITVKEFSEKTGVGASKLIATLLKNGIMGTMNSSIDYDTWSLLADDLDVQLKREETDHSVEDILEGNLAKLMEDDAENLEERPPVIVVMGHVDHGKTSILDFYRNSKVIDGEAGGITQHIGAYQIEKRKKLITFLDTPGHEAFTAMRARGAKITDITILVVAADEGIKTQTEEAINHAKEAGVPIIVAINKMDKDGADPERVKGELMAYDLVAEDYGGDVIMVPCSAKTGQGMEDLLDSILLQSEVLELKANPNRQAIATVIESHLDKSLGPVATVVVNTGTMKVGASMIAGSKVGKVRTIEDWTGKRVRVVLPSGAVQISGFEEVPMTGDIVQCVNNEKEARDRAAKIAELRGEREGHGGLGMGEIMSRIQSGKMDLLKIVLKADTQGSIQAINQMFAKIDNTEVGVKIIHSAVGDVSESDVMMAAASQGMVIAFHTSIASRVKNLAEKEHVEVQNYNIIYELVDDVKKILTGMLKPEELEIETGKADVKQVFLTTKKKQIIGARVQSGSLFNKGMVKVMRKGEKIYDTIISNLRSFDKNVSEVKSDNECGIEFPKKLDVQEGDEIICFTTEQKMKTL